MEQNEVRKAETMRIQKRGFIGIMVCVFVLGCALGMGFGRLTDDGAGKVEISKSEYKEIKQYKDKYEKVDELWGHIQSEAYNEPNEEALIDGLCSGLFAGLGDRYSSYMTKEEYEQYETSITGSFEGVGITFNADDKGEYVVAGTIKGSPAEKAGIKQGDIIKKVDGKTYDTADKTATAIRGKKGTKVVLTIERDGKTKDYELTRDEIVTETVESDVLDGNIGYIKITEFDETTDEDFEKALDEIEKKDVKGFILDLRNNGGGLVDSSTHIADRILGKGVITYMEDRSGKKEYYRSDADKTRLPYVVLVNEYTASASEILTGAVKDMGQGKIVGIKTFGKGVVQISRKLSDGSAYKLTVMQYFSPEGHVINEKGIQPDYKVKGEKQQLEKAKELLK